MKIKFMPSGREIHANSGENLLKIAEKAGVLIDASCAGAKKCGKCKVKITNGQTSDLTPAEENLLSQFEISNGYRLACCLEVTSDLEVYVPNSHGGSTRKKKITNLPEDFIPETRITSTYQKVPKATLKYQKNDLARIADTFEKEKIVPAAGLITKIHAVLEAERGAVTATFRDNNLLALEAGDTSDNCYGVAFDIGTTTVVGMLWNFKDNTLVDVEARTNYQSNYGSDVISRIQFCNQDNENISLMQEKVISCFNDILEDIYVRNQILPQHVYDVTVVGNTTMSHLVLGVHPKSMARTPFAPVFCDAQNLTAKELGIRVNPRANVFLLPNIAGHVGSDIVGMMLSTHIYKLNGNHIAIDIGTNGEVVAIKDGKMLCCSTAAGPAFEGASIHHGMRAAAGAVEKVSIEKDSKGNNLIAIKTIDNASPVGLCGSGLIDAVATLLDVGIIEPSGRMLSQEEAEEEGIAASITKQIISFENHPAFILAHRGNDEPVILTQQDIREVQLAKGAILAGMQTLMKTLGMKEKDIDSIMLAGAFGNYIDKRSALRIGLFPQVPEGKIISVGNAAGAGASMALLSDAEREKASEIAQVTEHIELSMNMDFQEFYMYAMTFE